MAAPVTERVITLLFNGAYPSVAPTITTFDQDDYTATENLSLPRNVDMWAQAEGRAYYREGEVYSSGL